MSELPTNKEPVRRLVIGLRDVSYSMAEIETIAGLAQKLHSQLLGEFLEDESLVQWCASQQTHLLRHRRHALAMLTPAQISEEFAAAASLMRQRMDRAAARFGLTTGYRTARRSVSSLASVGAEPGDLEVVMEPASALARMSYPFTEILRAIALASAPILYVPHQARSRSGPVVVVTPEAPERETGPEEELAGLVDEQILRVPISAILADRPSPGAFRARASRHGGARPAEAAGTIETARMIVLRRQLMPQNQPTLFAAIARSRLVPVLVAGAVPTGRKT